MPTASSKPKQKRSASPQTVPAKPSQQPFLLKQPSVMGERLTQKEMQENALDSYLK